MADHALNTVSFKIDAPIPADWRDPVGARQNDGVNATIMEIVADGIARSAGIESFMFRLFLARHVTGHPSISARDSRC
jgi:hypothetical protein